MASNETSFHAGHRERLRQKFIDGKLADYELLEALLSYAIPRRDVRPLARSLVKRFGGVHDVLCANLDDLLQCPGVGRNTAIFLKMIHEIMSIGYKHQLADVPVFHNETILKNYCRTQLNTKNIEELHVLYLDDSHRLIEDQLHAKGTIDNVTFYHREIAKRALALNSRTVVLVHNHPISGGSFSIVDAEMTQELIDILSVLGIALYDHFVVSDGIVYSARELNLFKDKIPLNIPSK